MGYKAIPKSLNDGRELILIWNDHLGHNLPSVESLQARLHFNLVVPVHISSVVLLPWSRTLSHLELGFPMSPVRVEMAFSSQLVFIDHPFGREVVNVTVDAQALSR